MWLGTAVSAYVCLDVSGICSGLCIFLRVHPVSASEDSFPPYRPGQGGLLSCSKPREPGTLGVTKKRRWSSGKVDKDHKERLMAVMSPAQSPTAQSSGVLAALGVPAAPELFLLRRSRACGICLSAPTWHHAFHRAPTHWCSLEKKK